MEERIKTTAQGFQMVMEQARKIGIAESTMSLANECMESMKKIISGNKSLKTLLNNLLKNQGTFRYRHSLMINYVGAHIVKKMPWGSKEHQEKLSFVSFFHDIALSKDEYLDYRTDKKLKESSLSSKEKESINTHPLTAAKLLAQLKRIPFGTETIIKQHHGSPTGVGFNKISVNLSPLAIVFILAEECVHFIIGHDERGVDLDKERLIAHLQKKYNIPSFQKIIPTLKSLEL